jgi:hypothetical protein
MKRKDHKPWDRLAEVGESVRAHGLFMIYVGLGPQRNYSLTAKQSGRMPQTIAGLGARFKWIQRARSYDTYLRKMAAKAVEAQVKNDAILFTQREADYRHEAWDFAEKLFAKAKEMLEAPLYKITVKETQIVRVGGKKVEVPLIVEKTPIRWNLRDIVPIGDLSDRIRRLALGVPTSRTAHEITPTQSLDEKVAHAKANLKHWKEHKLEKAVQRIMKDNPDQDPALVREELLAEAPSWFAEDFQIDPLLLTDGTETQPPPLDIVDGEIIEEEGVQ